MPLVNIKHVPINESFMTGATNRIGYRINEYIGGVWVHLGPSLNPRYVFLEERKPVHPEFKVLYPVPTT